MSLSHLDEQGRPRMVDVGEKPESRRWARATGSIRMKPEALELILGNTGPKGDVLSTAELAGVMGAKHTSELIPLCHPIALDHVAVTAEPDPGLPGVRVVAEVAAVGRTGVEMEVLTAVALSLLTIYDMVKSTGHEMEIGEIRLLEKRGGVRGDWQRDQERV
jgi:cyclic pyranopterin phosphate synthase